MPYLIATLSSGVNAVVALRAVLPNIELALADAGANGVDGAVALDGLIADDLRVHRGGSAAGNSQQGEETRQL